MAGFPIVGIGSSAGGLEALQKLFRAMPPDSGLAFVLAAHLDPTQKSHMAELVGRCTRMPVVEIERVTEVAPDHVYVIAPNQELTIRDGRLHTAEPGAPRGQRHPVDYFFRSLAEDQGERAIAIVLSGTGTNGSQGLRFIKAEGGIAIAQDPGTTKFSGMPRAAIGTGVVDIVLPPEKIPEALLGLATHTYIRQPEKVAEEAAPDHTLDELLTLLRRETRQDFRSYKKQTLLRRIFRRMGLHRIEGLDEYLHRLREDRDEVSALVADLTINVTGFFRDPEAWRGLDEQVIGPLVEEREAGSTLRVWVPGCSTGEEAYSVAMLLVERSEATGTSFDFRIFATDVAQSVLATARAGIYPASIEADVDPERLKRFFDREDDSYTVSRPLRETITFAPQNLLQDAPFSRMDLISCRNLLIYLKPETQKKLLRLFHFALREGGHLFLGSAETIAGEEELFETVSKKWRIYRRIGQTRHDIVDFPLVAPEGTAASAPDPAQPPAPRVTAREIVEQMLLDRHGPAAALIDREHRVRYLRGPTDDYLRPESGEPSNNLLAMARPGLEMPLRTTVRKALDENREVTGDAWVCRGDMRYPVRLVVTPIRRAHGEGGLLVCFLESQSRPAAAPGETSEKARDDLQAQLDSARDDLRLTIEQMEAQNEDLKASNEEIRAINEELQASNEELETSKEELQSLNEELNTVNNQLQAKVGELEDRTNDLNNLLNSTDIATVFLDRKLCIRWFTPRVSGLINVRRGDIGRPISDVTSRFPDGDLVEEAERVLDRLTTSECEVEDDQGRWYIRRILPYRGTDDRIGGVVVSFVDITERKQAEGALEEAKTFAESIVDTVRDPLLVLGADLVVQSANAPFYGKFGTSREQTEGRSLFELGNRHWDIPDLRQLLEDVLPADKQIEGFEVTHAFPKLGTRTMLLNARQLDHVQKILIAIEDITDRRRAEQVQAEELQAMTVLQELGQRAIHADDLGSVLEEVLEALIRLHRADFGNIQLYDPTRKILRIAAQRGFGKRFLEYFAEVNAGDDSACGRALRTGERIIVEDTETDPLYAASREQARQAGYRAVQSTPLFAEGDRPLGMLSTHFAAPRQFSERELRYTDIAARMVADTIAGHWLQDALRTSQERLRRVLETAAIGVIILDESGTIVASNDAFLQMTGYRRAEVDAGELSWRRLTPEEWVAETEAQMARLGENGRIGPYEKEWYFKDGSRHWVLLVGRNLGDGTAVEYVIDINDRKQAEMERELLANELSHRVKNTLAVVQALAQMTNGRLKSIEAFREAFLGRLHALSRAHSYLLDSHWRSAEIKGLVEQAVKAFNIDNPEAIVVEGERLVITPKQALGLSLILHELGTNAVKYGSLSDHGGRLHIAWSVEQTGDGQHVRLVWQERSGPRVEAPDESGFGTNMIERVCSFELDGDARLEFAPEGLTCEIEFPLE